MKVKELIALLQQQDQEKELMIQQGMEFDYTLAYSVREMELVDMTDDSDEPEKMYVVIEYS